MAALCRVREFAVEKGKNLVAAAENGETEKLIELLNAGVSVNAEEYNKSLFYESKNYVTPLQCGVQNGNLECVKVLIEYGADLNATDRFDVTAVHIAAERGHHSCLKALLDAGAKLNIPTKHSKKGCYTAHPHPGGTTALHLASHNNHVECVMELIQYGADYNAVDEKGRTSLYIAAEAGYEDCILAHLRNAVGRDILSLPGLKSGDTPLHFCVMYGLDQCVAELLEHGSDVNHFNYGGYTPLVYSVLYNPALEKALDILKLLITRGHNTDVNLTDYAGLTPLHYVSFSDGHRFLRRAEMAAFLIAYGADPYITNQRGYTLLQTEMKSPSNNLTILKALAKSMLHFPPFPSLNVTLPQSPSTWAQDHLPPQPPQPHAPMPPHLGPLAPPYPNDEEVGMGRGPGEAFHNLMFVHHHRLAREIGFNNFKPSVKYEWYLSIASAPRSLQHYSRFVIRKAMGPKRLRHVKDLPIPSCLQDYLLLAYDEYK